MSGLIGVSRAGFPRVEEATNPLGFIFAADLGVNLKCGLGAAFFTFAVVGVILATPTVELGDAGGTPFTERLGIVTFPKGDPVIVACFGCCIIFPPPKEGKEEEEEGLDENPGEGDAFVEKLNPREDGASEFGLYIPVPTLEGAVPNDGKETLGVPPNKLLFPLGVDPNRLLDGKKELEVDGAVVDVALGKENPVDDVEGACCCPGNEKALEEGVGAVLPNEEGKLKPVEEVAGCPKVEVAEAGCPNVEVVEAGCPNALLVVDPNAEGVDPKVEVDGVDPKEVPKREGVLVGAGFPNAPKEG